jgi:hypothetical protein
MDLKNLPKLEKCYINEYSFLQNNADNIAKNIGIKRKDIALYWNRTDIYTKYIQSIRNKFNNIKNKKNKFSNFKEFFDWFENQEKECCYCKISQNNLEQLFNKELLVSKKFNGTLHIERFDSKKPYSKLNCGLACAICNNAKSDFISKKDFKIFIASSISKFLTTKIGELQ